MSNVKFYVESGKPSSGPLFLHKIMVMVNLRLEKYLTTKRRFFNFDPAIQGWNKFKY